MEFWSAVLWLVSSHVATGWDSLYLLPHVAIQAEHTQRAVHTALGVCAHTACSASSSAESLCHGSSSAGSLSHGASSLLPDLVCTHPVTLI